MLKLQDLNLDGQRILLRADMNVPLAAGNVTDDWRICACLPTIEYLIQHANSASIIILSHLGRPEEGISSPGLSLSPVAQRLEKLLKKKVRFESDYLDGVIINAGEIVMCENVRFNSGEKANNEELAQQYAGLCDIFVMDAFATAHRVHASTHGVMQFAPVVCAGLLMQQEIDTLSELVKPSLTPSLAIVSGAKISTKLGVLEALATQVDCLVVGGGIANILLLAKGYNIGKSLCQVDLLNAAKCLLETVKTLKCELLLPKDVICVDTMHNNQIIRKCVDEVGDNDMIMDIGSDTCEAIEEKINQAALILWNGPVGVFEQKDFSQGTRQLACAVAKSDAYSIVGGGDTIAALNAFGISDKISYISTGGGAFLEFIEGTTLAAVQMLERRAST